MVMPARRRARLLRAFGDAPIRSAARHNSATPFRELRRRLTLQPTPPIAKPAFSPDPARSPAPKMIIEAMPDASARYDRRQDAGRRHLEKALLDPLAWSPPRTRTWGRATISKTLSSAPHNRGLSALA
jgi:hypothetical protein